jgi:hypothetical protein
MAAPSGFSYEQTILPELHGASGPHGAGSVQRGPLRMDSPLLVVGIGAAVAVVIAAVLLIAGVL